MTKSIKHSRSVTAVFVVAASFGWMTSVPTAAASELTTIVVVPADDDREYSAIEAAAYQADYDTALWREQTTSSSARVTRGPVRSMARPDKTQIAWPYTARTYDRK